MATGQAARSWRALRIFRAFGVDVYLHWTWVLGVILMPQLPKLMAAMYGQPVEREMPIWLGIVEYLCLFGIVLLHEFGHALACKSVGGRAEQIVLWPLGGIAFVQPPARPGAVLWSIAAGPLVNVLLMPVLILATLLVYLTPLKEVPWLMDLTFGVTVINVMIFLFNMLPIFPLDGGQILHALLWFIMGRGPSLLVCAVLGIVGAVAMMAGGLLVLQSPWLAILAVFGMSYSISAIRVAMMLIQAGE